MRSLKVPAGAIEGATRPAKRVADDPIIAGSTEVASTASTAGVAGSAGTVKKFTIRLDPELMGRIRAAFAADMAAGSGLNSLSSWATHHLEQAVLESERRGNGGRPRQPIGSGIFPTGPLG